MNSGIYFLCFPLLPVCPVRLNPSMGLLRPQRTAASHAHSRRNPCHKESTQTSQCWFSTAVTRGHGWWMHIYMTLITLTMFTPGINIRFGMFKHMWTELNPGVNRVPLKPCSRVAGDRFLATVHLLSKFTLMLPGKKTIATKQGF